MGNRKQTGQPNRPDDAKRGSRSEASPAERGAEREHIEPKTRQQTKAAPDEPVEGYQREVKPRPDRFEPERKRNLHGATIVIGFALFVVIVALIVVFVVF